MSFASDYPEQRYIIARTTLRREVVLPPDVKGVVMATTGQRVDGNTVVARGYAPAQHYILQAADELRLGRRQPLDEFLLVEVGDMVEAEQALASKRKDPDRGRRVFSPVKGIIVGIDARRIVVRENAEQIEVIAGLAGRVVDIHLGRGVEIETSGAVLQGVWGNGRRAVGALKMEPDDGMEFIEGGAINLDWRGTIVITRRPLTMTNLVIMEEQDIAGVIAPSMDSTLIDLVQQSERAVLLTEGFGNSDMSNVVFNMLYQVVDENFNVRATLDAVQPRYAVARRPEVVIGVRIKDGQEPKVLSPGSRLIKNARVRITRAPYGGQVGVIRELPTTPLPLGNGLSVPAAVIELAGGERVNIPHVNLELFDVT
jgi:hypothetical protein